MCGRMIHIISLVVALSLMCNASKADLAIAEELLVDLRAEDLPYGEGVTTWPNRGTLGDFTANGTPVVEDVDGVKTVTFDGSCWFVGPTATPGIEGAGTRSIEVWAYNPAIPGEETTVSWSHRGGPEGTNMAFNYGNDTRWGAMGHWSGDTHDMGWWTNHIPAPAANTWWHLAYTYDGTAARIYVNGEEESVRNPIALNTHGGNLIRVAAQADDSGAGVASQFNFTGSIAAVRIHDGVLSPADLRSNFRLGRLKAWNPNPADGALHPDTWASLSWSPGGFAVSHDVYFDDNFDRVNEGAGEAFRGNQGSTYFVVGFPGFAFPDGLVPGTTYYWRIDEVNDLHPDSPWRGNVWSFTVPSRKAHNPQPADGAKYIDPDVTLNWSPGLNAKLHTVYFGDDFDAVSNASGGAPGAAITYTPGPLELEKTYYWRVDEFDSVTTHKGDVWSFTTFPVLPVTDPNLMGWWKFDEGAGATVLDWSGQGHHASLLGGPRWITGYHDAAIKLDGSDDYVVLPIGSVISSLASATFTTWVDFSNIGGAWQRIFDFGSGTQTYIFLCPRTGTGGPMRLAITTGGGGGESLIDATATLPTGWHHVAAVIQSGSMQLYLDGVVAASGSTSVVPSDLGTTMNNWLGRSQYVADGYFNGSLDDFRIYNYAMTTDEISKTMRGDPLQAWDPSPADKSTPDIDAATPLSWSPGDRASEHDVYFGTEADAVDHADASDTTGIYRGRQSGTTYTPPEGVEWGGGPYYWRIDQVNADGTITKGRVWSFTVADFILVDDFEAYTNDDAAGQAIWQSWIDGFGVAGNGSQVGYLLPPYAEQTIVHSGVQSMPLFYDNTAGVTNSEATLTLVSPRDWTQQGVAELAIWFRGNPASVGSFVEGPSGTYTMTGSGADIWGAADQFHFALKTLTGAGSITARVVSVQNTDGWAKAGVMIRETLDAESKHAFACVTPSNGVASQGRIETGGESFNANQTSISAPYWVRLTRDLSGNFTVAHSANGTTWQAVSTAMPQNIQMSSNVYIGLALTSHNAALTCQAVFSNVTTTGTVSGQWANQDVGITSNAAEPLYVAVSNVNGTPAVAAHDDPAAAQIEDWTEWRVPLQTFSDQGVNLTDVDKLAIGLGTNAGLTGPGGSGTMYVDDIRLYRSGE